MKSYMITRSVILATLLASLHAYPAPYLRPLADSLASSPAWRVFAAPDSPFDRPLDDDDSDGLSNFVESNLAATVSSRFSPTNAFSLSPSHSTTDFFYKNPGLANCVGVLFTDHDWIEDPWEDSVSFASRSTHDFFSRPFHDGWTAWDYCRASLFDADPMIPPPLIRPSPSLRINAWYSDRQNVAGAPLVIHAFDSHDLSAPTAVFALSNASDIAFAPISATLDTPVYGRLNGGLNSFVAFLDLDGNSKYTAGEPMGCVPNVLVAWRSASLDVGLADTSPITTRFDLSDFYAPTDREAIKGIWDGDWTNLYVGVASGGRYERVRIIRTLVNDINVHKLGIPDCTVLDRTFSLDSRPYVCELDILSQNGPDIDWNDFADEVVTALGNNADPVTATYRVVLGDGPIESTTTNNLYRKAIVRSFDALDGRTTPSCLSVDSSSSRPVFSWSMKNASPLMPDLSLDNTSYSAFRLQILNGGSAVYDSGVLPAPNPRKDGSYSFSPPVFFGDSLSFGSPYSWRVSMYNSKFKDDDFSPSSSFSSPPQSSFPSLLASVSYSGTSSGTLRVFAFDSPDFASVPIASASASSFSSNATALVSLHLPPLAPAPFLFAFLDLDSDRSPDPSEPFGYLICPPASPFTFNPAQANSTTNSIFILDI